MHHFLKGRVRPDLTGAQEPIYEKPNEQSSRLSTEGYLGNNINARARSAYLDNSRAAHTYSQSVPTRPVARDVANSLPLRAYSVDNGPSNFCGAMEGSRTDDRDLEDLQRQFQRSGRSLSTPNYADNANGMAMRPELLIQQQTFGETPTRYSNSKYRDGKHPSQFQHASVGTYYPSAESDRIVVNSDGSRSLRRPDGSLELLTGSWQTLSNDREARIRPEPSIQRRPVGLSGNGRRQSAAAAVSEGQDHAQTDSSYSQSNNNRPPDLYDTPFSNTSPPIPTSSYGTSYPNDFWGSDGNKNRHQRSKATNAGVAPDAGFEPQYGAVVNGLGSLGINGEETYLPAVGNDVRSFTEPAPAPESSIPSRNNSMASSNSQYSIKSGASRDSYGGRYEDNRDSIDFLQSFEMETTEEGYEEELLIWQGNNYTYATMTFDTGCKGSNWVSLEIVRKLRPRLKQLPRPVEFEAFNGQLLTATFETTLSFSKDRGPERSARFLVAPNEDVPFEILLGAGDCRRFKILPPPMLGLLPRRQNKAEKVEMKANVDNQNDAAKKHEERRTRRDEEKRAAKEAELRGGTETMGGDHGGR